MGQGVDQAGECWPLSAQCERQLAAQILISSSHKMDLRTVYLSEPRGLVAGMFPRCGYLPGEKGDRWAEPPRDASWQPGTVWQPRTDSPPDAQYLSRFHKL